MSLIHLYYLLVNTRQELTEVLHETYPVEESILPFSYLIGKIKSFTKHQLLESYSFQIDDLTETFLQKDDNELVTQYFKRMSFLNDVSVLPVPPALDSVSSVFFVLKEKQKQGLPLLHFTQDASSDCQLLPDDVSVVFPPSKTRKQLVLNPKLTKRRITLKN